MTQMLSQVNWIAMSAAEVVEHFAAGGAPLVVALDSGAELAVVDATWTPYGMTDLLAASGHALVHPSEQLEAQELEEP